MKAARAFFRLTLLFDEVLCERLGGLSVVLLEILFYDHRILVLCKNILDLLGFVRSISAAATTWRSSTSISSRCLPRLRRSSRRPRSSSSCPPPLHRIIGDMSNNPRVLVALDLRPGN